MMKYDNQEKRNYYFKKMKDFHYYFFKCVPFLKINERTISVILKKKIFQIVCSKNPNT